MIDPKIHVTRWGNVGPKVVLVHGSAQGSSRLIGELHFPLQQRLAERGYQVIVPDRPGHGRSPYLGHPDDAEVDGAWVAELLGDGAHLVGHSYGGCVALAAAAMKPTAVRSLTLIEPAMPTVAMNNPAVMKFGMKIMMARLFSLSKASRTRKFNQIVGIPEEIQRVGSTEDAEKVGEGLRNLKMPSKGQLTQWLDIVKNAKIPFLVVSGGWNPAFEALSDVVAGLGGGRRVVIRSEHHFPQRISDEFNQVLAGAIDAVEEKRT